MTRVRFSFGGGEGRRRALILHAFLLAPPERGGHPARRFPRRPAQLPAGLVASLLAVPSFVDRPTVPTDDVTANHAGRPETTASAAGRAASPNVSGHHELELTP